MFPYPQMYLHEIPQLKTPQPEAYAQSINHNHNYYQSSSSFLPSYRGIQYEIQDLPPISIQQLPHHMYPKSLQKSLIPQSLKPSIHKKYIYEVTESPKIMHKSKYKPEKKWPYGSESESSIASDGMYGYFTADDEKSIGTQSIASNASAEVYSILFESEQRKAERERRRKSPFPKSLRQKTQLKNNDSLKEKTTQDNLMSKRSKNLDMIATHMKQAKEAKVSIEKSDLKKDLEAFLPKLNSMKPTHVEQKLENPSSIPVYSWSNSTKPIVLKAPAYYSQANPRTGKFELVSPSTYQLQIKELLEIETKVPKIQSPKYQQSEVIITKPMSTMFTKIKEEKSSLNIDIPLGQKLSNDTNMSSVDSGVGSSLSPKKYSSKMEVHLTDNTKAQEPIKRVSATIIHRANSNISNKTEDSGIDVNIHPKKLDFEANDKNNSTSISTPKIPVLRRNDSAKVSKSSSLSSSLSSSQPSNQMPVTKIVEQKPMSASTTKQQSIPFSAQKVKPSIATKIPSLVNTTKPSLGINRQETALKTKEALNVNGSGQRVPQQQIKKSFAQLIEVKKQTISLVKPVEQKNISIVKQNNTVDKPRFSTSTNIRKTTTYNKPIPEIQTKKIPVISRTRVVVRPAVTAVKLRIEPKINVVKQTQPLKKTPLTTKPQVQTTSKPKQDVTKPLNNPIRPNFTFKKATTTTTSIRLPLVLTPIQKINKIQPNIKPLPSFKFR